DFDFSADMNAALGTICQTNGRQEILESLKIVEKESRKISGAFAFRLYDEQGFPLDLTQLLARERGFAVDNIGFEQLMENQRARARAAQKKQIIAVEEDSGDVISDFVGYENTK